MPKNKSVVVTTAADSEEENLLSLAHDHQNGFDKHNSNNTEDAQVVDYDQLNGPDKELYLLKLPKELIKYQKQHNDLKLNLNDIKSGTKFTVQNIDYDATITKSKVSFNCLCKNGDSYQAVNTFKHIIHVKRCIDIPQVQAPEIVHKKVEVPALIESYVEKRNLSLIEQTDAEDKTHKSKKSKKKKRSSLDNELNGIEGALIKKIKIEIVDESFIKQQKTKKMK